MNRLSDATVLLIRSLYTKKSLWERFAHPDLQDEIIRKVADAGEPAAIPDLLPILIIGNRKLVWTCADAIQRLLMHLKPSDFVHFDEYVRRGYSDWGVDWEPWYSIKPTDLVHLAKIREASASLLGIASCHGNGHVREEAVRELGEIETGAELPFLLLRANDWVSVIRLSARSLLTSRVRPDYVRHFLDWLPLVLRLRKTSRDDQSWILDAVTRLLQGSEARQALYKACESQDYHVRRFCFGLALKGRSELATVMQRAFESRDQQVRKNAAQQLSAVLPNDELKKFLVRARNDAWMPIRREALHLYSQKYQEEAEVEFHTALLDPNVAIREEAQYFFRRRATLELRSYYLGILESSEGAKLSAAIAGLGEVGEANDSTLLERFISATSTKVRVAAVRAIARLDPTSYIGQFLGALDDPSAKVTREALLALGKKPNSIGGDRLWEVYGNCHYLHGKRAVLHLLARVTKWDSIAFLIQSLADEDSSLTELGKKYVARWFTRYNRSLITPNTNQLTRLRGVLSRYGLLVSSGTQQQLASLLESF